MKSALIDLVALECLNAFPRDLDRLLVVVQISPRRREALQQAFPGAEIVETWPPGDGAWHEAVERALGALKRVDVSFLGAPLLECLTELWRGELERLFALSHAWASGGLAVVCSSPWHRMAVRLATLKPGLNVVGLAGGGIERQTLAARALRSGRRGLALALGSRLDPSYVRRARFTRPPRLRGSFSTLVVSSYVNTTKAALRLWASEPQDQEALLLETGPMASYQTEVPRNLTRLSLAAALTCRSRETKALREKPAEEAVSAFNQWRAPLASGIDAVPLAPLLGGAKFVRQLESVHLPGLVSSLIAVDNLVGQFGVKRLIVGNEFGASERAALRSVLSRGLEAHACQHGVIDGHYRREGVIATTFWTWDRESSDMMARWGAASPDRLRVLPATGRPARGNVVTGRRRDVVLFSQPYQLIPLPPEDLIAETVPVLERVCRSAGARLVLKPHPLQTKRQLAAWFSGNTLPRCDSRSPMEVLATSAVAVVLDSSVVIDCRAAAVPCIGVGWYAGQYGKELEDLGYLVRARSPEHLESLVARELEQRGA